MEQRTHDGIEAIAQAQAPAPAAPPSPLTVASRWGLAAWLPAWLVMTAAFDLRLPLAATLTGLAVLVLLCLGADGGRWRKVHLRPRPGLPQLAGSLALLAALAVAMVLDEPLVAAVPGLLGLGAVLGAATTRLRLARSAA